MFRINSQQSQVKNLFQYLTEGARSQMKLVEENALWVLFMADGSLAWFTWMTNLLPHLKCQLAIKEKRNFRA